jgi:hypothetical protein
MENSITFTVKVLDQGSGSMKSVTVAGEQLQNVLRGTTEAAGALNGKLVNTASVAMSLQGAFMGIGMIASQVNHLTETFGLQEEAEVKLETVMRQRAHATDAEIESVKRLASEQQKIGVIGDEVQLAGAQQIATFVNEKSTIETLIPAMNNLLVQRNGLNSTQENAVEIGNLMGKAMQGQTTMLQRVGITFTEAQQKVLKYGNETQRAAMLAQVITDNVGNMNEQFAKLDAGKAKQWSNTFGDWAEKVGKVLTPMEPLLTALTSVGMTFISINMVANAFGNIATAVKAALVAKSTDTAVTGIQAQALRILTTVTGGATVSTTALTAATVALAAVYTAGLALAIYGIVKAVEAMTSATDEEAEAEERAKEATEAAKRAKDEERSTMSSARAELDINIGKLKDFRGSKEQEKKLVDDMNTKYGEAIGYYSTVSGWYNALVQNSENYCRQMVIEVQMRNLANQAAQSADQINAIKGKNYSNQKNYEFGPMGTDPTSGVTLYGWSKTGASDAEVAKKKIDEAADSYRNLMKQMQDLAKEQSKLSAQIHTGDWVRPDLGGGGGGGNGGSDAKDAAAMAGSLREANEQYEQLVKKRDSLTTGTAAWIKVDADVKMAEAKLEGLKAKANGTFASIHIDAGGSFDAKGAGGSMQTNLAKGLENSGISKVTKDIETYQRTMEQARKKQMEMQNGVRAMGSIFATLGEHVKGAAGDWLTWGGNVLSAVAEALPAILSLIPAHKAKATAQAADMATGAGSAVASIPWVGPVMAVAAIASVLAALASLPKFSAGGIAYGATLGMFGEYAGAANNPEVVAPLDKLQTLIGGGGGQVEFRIKDRELYGILKRYDNRRIRG